MRGKTIIKIITIIVAAALLILFIILIFVNPWIESKIREVFNEKSSKYQVIIDKVHVSVFTSSVKLETISVRNKPEFVNDRTLDIEIASINCNGISLRKIIFNKDVDVSEVIISKGSLRSVIKFSNDSVQSIISPLNFHIGKLLFEGINIAVKNTSSEELYSINGVVLNLFNLKILKDDTLTTGIVKKFDFKANEIQSISSDSMYTVTVNGILYSTTSKILKADSILIQPNYKVYDFTSRLKYQADCIEAEFKNIFIHELSAEIYIKSKSLISSYVEIGEMEVNVFRDLRKESSHIHKPMFQDIIYNFPGIVNIDSIALLNGNVTYIEHAIEANHPGRISFNEVNARLYKITNDTVLNNEKDFFELESSALLMGKGKLTVLLKAPLFDKHNAFSLSGALSAMEAKALNPMLERNAFLYAASGKLDEMNFYFTADDRKATGTMKMLYHNVDIAVKNEQTDDTTALKEKLSSWIANIKIMNSNPLPGKQVRVGIIDFKRDPETFIFSYCFKSILSGIKSSIVKSPSGKKN